jgi:hypothetical protein
VAKAKSTFYIVELLHGDVGVCLDVNGFRVIERMQTVDGKRDRITNRSFATVEEAEEFVRAKEKDRDDDDFGAVERERKDQKEVGQ